MKRFLIIVALIAFIHGFAFLHRAAAATTLTFDEFPVTDNGTQIGEEYAAQGIHFLDDTTGLTNPAITFYRSTMIPPGKENAVFWFPDPPPVGCSYTDYPYPTTQYLAMDKPQDGIVVTGTAMRFDTVCTGIDLLLRRPGNNLTETNITVAFFNTATSKQPHTTAQVKAYVCTPPAEDPDRDGWQAVAFSPPKPFNLVLFYADKKFAIDNFSFTSLVPDPGAGTVRISGVSLSPTGQAPVGDTVTFTVTAATNDATGIVYQFLRRAGYGETTPVKWGNNEWTVINDSTVTGPPGGGNWTGSNSISVTFTEIGNYFLAVHVLRTDDIGNTWVFGDVQGGVSIEVIDSVP